MGFFSKHTARLIATAEAAAEAAVLLILGIFAIFSPSFLACNYALSSFVENDLFQSLAIIGSIHLVNSRSLDHQMVRRLVGLKRKIKTLKISEQIDTTERVRAELHKGESVIFCCMAVSFLISPVTYYFSQNLYVAATANVTSLLVLYFSFKTLVETSKASRKYLNFKAKTKVNSTT